MLLMARSFIGSNRPEYISTLGRVLRMFIRDAVGLRFAWCRLGLALRATLRDTSGVPMRS